MEQIKNAIAQQQQALEIHQYGFTTTDKLIFSNGVRDLCEMNSCGHYAKTWACPPGVGTLEECREKIMKFQNAFVFTTKHDLEDSYDFEGMMEGKAHHDDICDAVTEYFKSIYHGDALILSGESCSRCSKCTYPDAPCRFPEKLSPSIESYGVEVNRLAKIVNVNYINGANTVTYFGCILF
jgi:predicted metal-binding protein